MILKPITDTVHYDRVWVYDGINYKTYEEARDARRIDVLSRLDPAYFFDNSKFIIKHWDQLLELMIKIEDAE